MAVIEMKAETNRIRLEEHIPLDTPMRVIIDPSSVCNFRCYYCPHGNKEARMTMPQSIMPAELAKKCIDDLTEFPQKIKKLLFAQIGEPLLNKELPEIVAYASKRAVAECLCITTNASVLTPELSEKLISAGIGRFDISLYGLNSESYQSFCKYSIDFDMLQKNIEYLYSIKKAAHIAVKISDAVCKTEKDEHEFYRRFSPICDTVCIEHMVPIWYDIGNFTVDDGFDIYMHTAQKKAVCPIPFYTMVVQSTGVVVPCSNDWNTQLPMGDAHKESLFSIWNGEKFCNLRINLLKNGCSSVSPCNRCKAHELCALDNIDPYRSDLLKRLEGEK